MKLAISNIAWDKEYDQEMYAYLQSEGMQGLEIAPTRFIEENPYERVDEAKKLIDSIQKQYGLKVCSMQSIWYGRNENLFESQHNRETLIQYTKKAIEYAHTIGCNNLVFGCPRNRNRAEHSLVEPAIDFFKTIGKYAEERGVVFGLEPNPTIYNTNFLNTTTETIDYLRQLNCPGLGLNLDWGSVIQNEESISILEHHIDLVNHIHISEPYLERIVKRESHLQLRQLLEKVGYEKYVSIEMKKQESLEDIKETIRYIKEVFQ